MRTIVALLAVLLVSPAAFAQRARTIADQLDVSAAVSAKVVTLLKTYDADLTRLHQQRTDLRRKMIAAHKDPAAVEALLDRSLANQRALVHADETLVTSLRTLLTPSQVVDVLVMLNASDPDAITDDDTRTTAATYDREALWPPGSHARRGCDPFEQMHRCPN